MLSVRNLSMVIVTTRRKARLTAKLITIFSLVICVTFVTKSSSVTVRINHYKIFVFNSRINVFFYLVVTALNKAWCSHHFACTMCDSKLNQRSKFFECDEKPVCKRCYDKLPNEFRRRLGRAHVYTPKKSVS